ncbi:hypothetical protein [Mangrovicoccus sp. HB161399]|uniref:hypothetical protein n=1 Tax=Mangrovicoccus sp. HB161399 TaxID=2720392 RepID=UPI001554E207|nr:hypothetical protein [Mangrovicoccus sp. HB161399]
MPNVKLLVEDSLWSDRGEAIRACLLPMREMLCAELDVPVAACQIAAIPFAGIPDQPQVNLELLILPRPDRTREKLTALGEKLRSHYASATGGAPMAVRFAELVPETYVALK